jgi:hypothetical protein
MIYAIADERLPSGWRFEVEFCVSLAGVHLKESYRLVRVISECSVLQKVSGREHT